MMNPKKALIIAVLLLGIVVSISVSNVQAQFLEIDTTAEVWNVIDGDTFDAFPVGRIRSADINAPEYNKTGYEDSRNYLKELIDGKQVYLDVDDNYMDDSDERLICVVYVRKNSTHLWNVNKKMILENYAVENDFTNNEFDPETWNEIVYYPSTDLPERSYPQLLLDYIHLKDDYENLQIEYVTLASQYDTLNSIYMQLQTDYSLLQTQYEQSSSFLNLYQPLSYVLIAVSVILGVLLMKQKL